MPMNEYEKKLAEEILTLAEASSKVFGLVFEFLDEAKIVEMKTALAVILNKIQPGIQEPQCNAEHRFYQSLADVLTSKTLRK